MLVWFRIKLLFIEIRDPLEYRKSIQLDFILEVTIGYKLLPGLGVNNHDIY